jgi:hypothetical protein
VGDKTVVACDNAKFLGLNFDSKLLWGKQINESKQKANGAINVIKTLAHTKWGSNQNTLIRLHKTLVISKLEYGSELYGSAAKTYPQKLDSIHNTGMRLSLGPFCTNPIESFLMESELPDLEMRKNSRVLRIGGRIITISVRGYNKTFGSRFQGLLNVHRSQLIRK